MGIIRLVISCSQKVVMSKLKRTMQHCVNVMCKIINTYGCFCFDLMLVKLSLL